MAGCPPCRWPQENPCPCERGPALQGELEARHLAESGERRYRTIVVDPPWPYSTRDAMVRSVKKDGSLAHGVGHPVAFYDYLDMDALYALPIGEWAAREAHLYLWTTSAFMEEAYQLARAWGFRAKTIITWVKIKEDGTPSMKTGAWFRGATEHSLFAVRGRLPKPDGVSLPTALLRRRLGHSEKPAVFYDMVESMSPGPYLDVFARKLRFNWDAWGDEVGAPEGLPTPEQVAARAVMPLGEGGRDG